LTAGFIEMLPLFEIEKEKQQNFHIWFFIKLLFTILTVQDKFCICGRNQDNLLIC